MNQGLTQAIIDKYYKIKAAVRYAFFSVIISGLLFHFASMTQKYFNYFEMGNIFSHMPFAQEDTIALGRWFLPTTSNIFTYFSMPVWNTVILLIYMAFSVAMIVDLMDIRQKYLGALFGIVFAAFPGIVCVLSYGVNSDIFSAAIFLAVLSVYLFEKTKYGVLWGAIALAFCIGTYQPYMSVTIGGIYCILFCYIVKENPSWKQLIMKTLKSVIMLIAGFALYYAILKVILMVTGISLSDYHGVDSMTSFTVKGLIKGTVYAYIYLIRYFWTTDYLYSYVAIVFNIAAFIALIIMAVKQTKHNKITLIQTILMIILLPVGLNASPVLMADRVGAGVDRYMMFSITFVWAVLIFLLDKIEYEKSTKLVSWIALVSICVGVFNSNMVDQKAYYAMAASTKSVESMMNRLAMRIEETEGWYGDMPVCLVGSRYLINDNYSVEVPELDSVKNMPGTFYRHGYSDEAVYQYFKVFLHFPMEVVDEQNKESLMNTTEYSQMKAYPDASAIRIIDGVMVIKFDDENKKKEE